MNVAFTVENDGQSVVEWAGTIQGTIDWQTDGRDGSCAVAMDFSGRTDAGGVATAEMMGAVCGFNISQTVSIG